jgi:predicted negative regulator of RcsB-dependent stress response
MNTYNLSDKEQVELVKNWFKKYGLSIISGILIALIGTYGWNYWQQRQTIQSDQASMLYEQMLSSDTSRQLDQFNATAVALIKDYSHTPYAGLAALSLANHAINQNNLPEAEKQLRWAMQNAKDKGVKEIAQLRAARVLIAENQPQSAISLLQNTDKNFGSAAEIIRGDAYAAMQDKTRARIAYQKALSTLPEGAIIRQLVQMKLKELGRS